MSYHAMRLRWCSLAVRQWLRRWGVYAVVTAAVVGAGTNAPVAVVTSLAGWLVTPLCLAATQGAWLLPATLLQALAGAGCVWGARALLWPPHWAESERALPLPRHVTRRSDAWLAAATLLPLVVLYAVGTMALLGAQPAWLLPVRGRALAALLLATLGSLGLGVMLLQRLRRAPRAGPFGTPAAAVQSLPATGARGAGASTRPGRSRPVPLAWPLPLLLMPLWRGPAQRTGRLLALGTLALLLPVAATQRWPALVSWALALQATAGLVVTTRASALSRLELSPLLDACASLPLHRPRLERARALLCLLPWAAAAAPWGAVLAGRAVRWPVLGAWLATCAASAAVEVLAAPAEPSDKAARWLFCLALCVALATEVMR